MLIVNNRNSRFSRSGSDGGLRREFGTCYKASRVAPILGAKRLTVNDTARVNPMPRKERHCFSPLLSAKFCAGAGTSCQSLRSQRNSDRPFQQGESWRLSRAIRTRPARTTRNPDESNQRVAKTQCVTNRQADGKCQQP